ncbi:MAG: trypsin-like peptidase domain-containing protein [Actinomycetaceae bacterium]|nr:trypsin-like peptidase domain-containing protein [Actinomycetaceae bacterium]
MQSPQTPQIPQSQPNPYGTYARTSLYAPQSQPYQQTTYPYPSQPGAQTQGYGYPGTTYGYNYPYQPWQTPATEPKKSKWGVAIIAAVAAVALILGGFTGAGIISALNDDTSQSVPNNWDAEPDYGNGVFGEDGSDPFFPEGTQGNSSGSRVESAPGVLVINSMLTGGIGSGSGMVISADGYAVTNYHVVEGSTTVRVTVADTEKTYNATVVGHDASIDIALLKLEDVKDLDYVEFDTAAPKKGTDVSVVGNAGGQGYLSQLEGTITAVDQDITALTDGEGSEDLTGLIRTDADVVQGYSGGPMFNKAGKVIGVVVAASSTSGRSGDTDGYAIPAKTVKSVVDQIKTGKSKGSTIVGANAALGVTVTSENLDGTSRVRGANVVQVNRGSAAEKAGIKAGDVITSVNGKSISSASDLSKLVKTFSIGDTVEITYIDSAGEEKTVKAKLGESPVN